MIIIFLYTSWVVLFVPLARREDKAASDIGDDYDETSEMTTQPVVGRYDVNMHVDVDHVDRKVDKTRKLSSKHCLEKPHHLSLFHDTYCYWLNGDKFMLFTSVYYDTQYNKTRRKQVRFLLFSSFRVRSRQQLHVITWNASSHCHVTLECKHTFIETVPPLHWRQKPARMLLHYYVVVCTLPSTTSLIDIENQQNYISVFASSQAPKRRQPVQKPELTSLAPILGPAPAQSTDPMLIGVCAGNLYGRFNLKNMFMFINWMEALLMFGVHQVSVNFLALNIQHETAKIMFDYYIAKQKLVVNRYPKMTDTDIRVHFVNQGDDMFVQVRESNLDTS